MVNAAPQPASGRFDGATHRFPVRVYFEDTDVAGVVYHANYLRFMERARSDMLRKAGIDQRTALEAGAGVYAVTEVAIRYRRPARLDDALVVASRVTDVRAAGCHIQQTVMRDADILAEAEVIAVFVGPDGRARRQPRDWMARFETLKGIEG